MKNATRISIITLIGLLPLSCAGFASADRELPCPVDPNSRESILLVDDEAIRGKRGALQLRHAIEISDAVLASTGFARQVERFPWKSTRWRLEDSTGKCLGEGLADISPEEVLLDLLVAKEFHLTTGPKLSEAETDFHRATVDVRASRLRDSCPSIHSVRLDLVNTIVHESLHLLGATGSSTCAETAASSPNPVCYKYTDGSSDQEEVAAEFLASYRAGNLAQCFLSSAVGACGDDWRSCGLGNGPSQLNALVDACMDGTMISGRVFEGMECMEMPTQHGTP